MLKKRGVLPSQSNSRMHLVEIQGLAFLRERLEGFSHIQIKDWEKKGETVE